MASLTLRVLMNEAEVLAQGGASIGMHVIETEPSLVKGNIKSCLVSLDGADAPAFAQSWTGSIQWIGYSVYRPHHKRKNWFVSVRLFAPFASDEAMAALPHDEVRFETARSGGPGGQYTNKTETAVRAIHIPSGKSAISRDERSQLLNKKRALARLTALLEQEQAAREQEARAGIRHTHYEVERGNPTRIYDAKTLQRRGNDDNHQQEI
jgi:peptide chain release factor